MLCRHFLAICRSGKEKFDYQTKIFLNQPSMTDNQLLAKNATSVPKNRNALGEIDTTNKIPDKLQDSCNEIFQLNEDRFSKLPLKGH